MSDYDDRQNEIGDEVADREDFVCPMCRGRRTVQPDRCTPAEPCPRCVDEDEPVDV